MRYSPVWRAIVVAVLRPLLFCLLKRDWKGQGNIPREGGVIIAPNHLSEADPLPGRVPAPSPMLCRLPGFRHGTNANADCVIQPPCGRDLPTATTQCA